MPNFINTTTKFIIKNRGVIFAFFLFTVHVHSIAQEEGNASLIFSISEVALVDIEPEGIDISLALTPQVQAGFPLVDVDSPDNSIWINYTSSLASGSNTRSVSVQIANGSVPSGIQLQINVSPDEGKGKGQAGIPVEKIYLTDSPQAIITGIGRCFTGNGPNCGHKLTYSLDISDFSELRNNENTTLFIAYTITDN